MNTNRTTALTDILQQVPGITAVIGGGGKSTLLAVGGRGLAERGRRTILATSTHMYPVRGLPVLERPAFAPRTAPVGTADGTADADAEAAETASGPQAERPAEAAPAGDLLVQVGRVEAASGKLTAPAVAWETLAAATDHVLVEADGSRGLPFKAHNEYEPVIPEGCARVIYVVGASGFGLPVYDVVHRPQLFRRITDAAPYEPVTPELAARAICAEGLVGMPDDLIVVNQAETEEAARQAVAFARALSPVLICPVYAGSLRAGQLVRIA